MEELKLKDPHVVRLFISSPFNGMEKERDILTKFYWPKIESALSAKGLHLRLVDMRWGITHSSSSDSQTINICLKEINRSDIFIGLFGQRYGWNGRNDPVLQNNFDKAAEKFPWVDHYRDRSVTELEFLHGHLNNPGNMPACFCFRDKSYDDKMKIDAEANGNLKKQRNFTSEDDNSFQKLQDIRNHVQNTESKTLGVTMDYKDPQDAADFIYKKVWNYVENEIIAKIQTPMSEKEKVYHAHKTYKTSQCGFYVGGQKYIDSLDDYINEATKEYHPLTVIGPTGCGKSALLSNWLEEKVKLFESKSTQNLFYYHLVGAEPESILPRYLMTRLIDYVQVSLTGKEFEYKKEKEESLSKLYDKTVETLAEMKLDEHKDKRLIIVIDGVDKIKGGKTSMPLFWLPKDLPSNVRVILSLTEGAPSADSVIEILTEGHNTEIMKIEPLIEEEKLAMCTTLLEENSKSMEQEQLTMITSSEKTTNPFFLKILINELCVAGHFRQLSQQISNLLESEDVLGLLVKVLERIREDYSTAEYAGDVVEEVLCALCLCKEGISESEFPMAQHLWAPVIFAINGFLTDRGSILSFAFPEINKAVQQVFMKTDEDRQAIAGRISKIFFVQYKGQLKNGKEVNLRTATELLHLLKESQDRSLLLQVISDIQVFDTLRKTGHFQLNEYWQWLGTPAQVIARRYVRSLDIHTAEQYSSQLNYFEMESWKKVLNNKSDFIQYVRQWFEDSKLFHGTGYLFERELELESNRPCISDANRQNIQCVVKYQKACFLSEIEKYQEALELHKEVLEARNNLIKTKVMDEEDIALSYHGIGLCHFNLKDLVEAEKYYKLSIEVWKNDPKFKIQLSNTYCNLGLVEMDNKKLDEALEYFEKSNSLKQEAQPNTLSLEIAYNYHNIGLAYRKKKELDMAEKYYFKSLKVKEDLLGRNSFDVALSIMNIGAIEVHRKNHEKGLEYARESLRIFEILAPEGSNRTVMAKENVVNQLTKLEKYEEAVPLFKDVCAYLKTMPGGSANGLPTLHRRFIKWYLKKDNYEDAADIALELVKCSKCKPVDYAFLGIADNNLPLEKKTDRPESVTLDYGLQKYPTNNDILMVKMENLINDKEVKLLPFVFKHCEMESLCDTEDRYIAVVDCLKDGVEVLDKAIAVLREAVERHPESTKLSSKLESLCPSKESEK